LKMALPYWVLPLLVFCYDDGVYAIAAS